MRIVSGLPLGTHTIRFDPKGVKLNGQGNVVSEPHLFGMLGLLLRLGVIYPTQCGLLFSGLELTFYGTGLDIVKRLI